MSDGNEIKSSGPDPFSQDPYRNLPKAVLARFDLAYWDINLEALKEMHNNLFTSSTNKELICTLIAEAHMNRIYEVEPDSGKVIYLALLILERMKKGEGEDN